MNFPRFLALLAFLSGSFAFAVQLASPFGDHMVLQRDQAVPVWGRAAAGEHVTVEFAGQAVSTVADAAGHWRLKLAALTASAEPREFTVKGGETTPSLTLRDVVVGEVWLCGGQSNMERQLGPRPPQPEILHWQTEAAAARFPLIRQLQVQQSIAATPQETVPATWTVCSPETVVDFSAVGYFFARDLHARLGVPVGILHSSWGGTPAEAWTSEAGLAGFPAFAGPLNALRRLMADPETARRDYLEKLAHWYRRHDAGAGEPGWQSPELDTGGWETMPLPAAWETAGHPGFDGIVWFRKTFDLPAGWAGRDVELRLSAVDDVDTTWVNGIEVGAGSGWSRPRVYRVPAAALRPTGNVIAVRVLDTAGNGGIWNAALPFELAPAAGPGEPLSLAGPWLARFGAAFDWSDRPPVEPGKVPSTPTVLYNAMIAPLAPYAIRGVAFYQGEANAGRAAEYRSLLPALIGDWRRSWDQGDFPFLFVQIAPFKDMPPEIREAQALAWRETKNTAMIATLDVGDANDIHPANKAPVGARLALAARALAYGEAIEYSGPVFERLRVEGARAILSFTHLGGGLVAGDGPLRGFTVAGADGVFQPAQAEIVGDTVAVSSPAVAAPIAVRYGWANAAEGSLFNAAGLPAPPFRSDGPVPAAEPANASAARPIRVLIVDGYSNHDWRLTTTLLRGILEPTGLFTVTVSTAPPRADSPGWDTWRPAFRDHDVVIQNCNDYGGGPAWPREVREDFEAFVRAGGGVYIWHSANNAFVDWPAYNAMIGLGWRKKDFGPALALDASGAPVRIPAGEGRDSGHGKRLDTVVRRLGDHPIHTGLPRAWLTPDIEVYHHCRGPLENLTVLSYGFDPVTGMNWPLEWAVNYGEGRVYTSVFGHVWKGDTQPERMRCAGVQTVLVRALQWLAHREVTTTVPDDFPTESRVSVRPPIGLPAAAP